MAAPMIESQSRVVTFPEIEPFMWELLVGVLEDPCVARCVNIRQVIDMFPLYDKYQFLVGAQFCDAVLSEQCNAHMRQTPDYLMEILALANKFPDSLPKTYNASIVETSNRLNEISYATAFSIADLEQMIHSQKFLGKDALSVIRDFSDDEIKSSMFTSYLSLYFSKLERMGKRSLLPSLILQTQSGKSIRCVASTNGPTEYSGRDTYTFSGDLLQYRVFRLRETREWVISYKGKSKWIHPTSLNSFVPPRTGWKCLVEDDDEGQVEVVYQTHNI